MTFQNLMTDLIRPILFILAFNLALVAFFVALTALFPRRVAKTRAVADLMPGRAFAVGLVNFLFFGAITFILFTLVGQVGNELLRVILALPALFFLSALSVGLSFGLAGVVQLVGERLAASQPEIRRTVWGALALSLGSSLPFVGWFGLLPYSGLLGLGAFIVSFFFRERTTASPQPPETQ
jgi:hypothetical protein